MHSLCITKITQIAPDCLCLETQSGRFVIRLGYLKLTAPQLFLNNIQKEELCLSFSFDKSLDIENAMLSFGAERYALSLIARAEQCRYGLYCKLKKKAFPTSCINAALDFLQEKEYISDARFCSLWLQSHAVSKQQGKKRLFAELCKRGIQQTTALAALDEYFKEEGKEENFCKIAFEKYKKHHNQKDKIIVYLQKSGFPLKMILKIVQ